MYTCSGHVTQGRVCVCSYFVCVFLCELYVLYLTCLKRAMAISLNKLNVCIHQSTDTYMPLFLHAHTVFHVTVCLNDSTLFLGEIFFYINIKPLLLVLDIIQAH